MNKKGLGVRQLNPKGVQNQNGQVILFVALLSVVVSLLAALGVSHFNSSMGNTSSFINQKKTSYVAEGMLQLAVQELNSYLAQTLPTAVTSASATAQVANLSNFVPAGFSLVNPIGVQVVSTVTSSTIPNGPYQGMQSPLVTLNISVNVANGNNTVSSNLSVLMTLAEIFPFQFLIFADFPTITLDPGTPSSYLGRIQANGDLLLGSATTLQMGIIRAAGRVMNLGDPNCPVPIVQAGTVSVTSNSNFTAFQPLTVANDHYCGGGLCPGGLTWAKYDVSNWHGNLQDVDNGINSLKFPGEGVGSSAQNGVSGTTFAVTSNNNNVRFTVDPPLATDSGPIAGEKYSNNADIRIVDGVWYLNIAGFPWPGKPIWSDHPGGADDAYGNKVGQDDLKALWGWGSIPQMYSYYQYDKANKKLVDNAYGVLSYGSLAANPNPAPVTPLIPSSWVDTTSFSPLCFGFNLSCVNGGTMSNRLFPAAVNPTATTCPGNVQLICGGGPDPKVPWSTMMLNAARSGFRNPSIETYSAANGLAQGKILPVNFDMGAFQNALSSTAAGELGSYFTAGGAMGRAFNGIIYVTSTWPCSFTNPNIPCANTGFSASLAPAYPSQGSVLDPSQPTAAFSGSGQQALPYPLCSNALAAAHAGVATKPFDSDTVSNRFVVPNCASYSYTTINAYPNAIRVFNGASISTALFPKGLSFVSNLPVYTVGDYNSSSLPLSAPSDTSSWVSTLVAGDTISILSNAWTDANDAWGSTTTYTSRIAATTNINAAIQGSYMQRNNAGALFNFLENWSGKNYTFYGSMIYAYNPVFQLSGSGGGTPIYLPPNRNYNFDQHFLLAENQPPGAIVFPIASVSKWNGN